jgi:uncharacterized phiE125 gp8 family phage protein
VGLTLITPPAAVPLSMAEARAHLRLEDDQSEDALIAGFIRIATAWVDGAEGWLGRALITQEWELRIDCFPWRTRIVLPLPPLQAVTSIHYTDQTGAEQLLASDRYRVLSIGDAQPGRIAPAYGTT